MRAPQQSTPRRAAAARRTEDGRESIPTATRQCDSNCEGFMVEKRMEGERMEGERMEGERMEGEIMEGEIMEGERLRTNDVEDNEETW